MQIHSCIIAGNRSSIDALFDQLDHAIDRFHAPGMDKRSDFSNLEFQGIEIARDPVTLRILFAHELPQLMDDIRHLDQLRPYECGERTLKRRRLIGHCEFASLDGFRTAEIIHHHKRGITSAFGSIDNRAHRTFFFGRVANQSVVGQSRQFFIPAIENPHADIRRQVRKAESDLALTPNGDRNTSDFDDLLVGKLLRVPSSLFNDFALFFLVQSHQDMDAGSSREVRRLDHPIFRAFFNDVERVLFRRQTLGWRDPVPAQVKSSSLEFLTKVLWSIIGQGRQNDFIVQQSIQSAHVELSIHDRIQGTRNRIVRFKWNGITLVVLQEFRIGRLPGLQNVDAINGLTALGIPEKHALLTIKQGTVAIHPRINRGHYRVGAIYCAETDPPVRVLKQLSGITIHKPRVGRKLVNLRRGSICSARRQKHLNPVGSSGPGFAQ